MSETGDRDIAVSYGAMRSYSSIPSGLQKDKRRDFIQLR